MSLRRWREAGLIIPTLMTLAMLPVLISLGTWQWHRKAWKEDLIARRAAGRTAAPVSLGEVLGRYKAGENIEYTRVRATGTFQHDSERHVYAPHEESQGWDVYTILGTEAGPVYVLRGWVPDKLKDPATRHDGQVPGPVTVTGLARLPESKGYFTPDDDAKGNRWFHRDAIEFQWNGASPDERARELPAGILPFTIDAEPEPANPGGWPKATPTEIRLGNRHLEYVVTWWGLAVTLLVVYGLFVRQRLKKTGTDAPTT